MINVVLDNNSKYVTFNVYGMSGKDIKNISYISFNGIGAYAKETYENVFWTDKHPLYVSFRVNKNDFLYMIENMNEDGLIEFYNSTTQEILLKDTLKITYENEIEKAHEPIDDITSVELTQKSEKSEYKFYNEYC